MNLWDIVQQIQIESLKARQSLGESSAEHGAARSKVRDSALEQKFARLALVTEAMWELVSERLDLTVTELAAHMRAIDARDGIEDARRGARKDAPVVYCASCQAVVPHGNRACQFCGTAVPGREADPFLI